MPPPIDPRQLMQAQALRGGPPGGMPMPGVPPGGIPGSPYAGGPQSGLGLVTPAAPASGGIPLTAESAAMQRGVPQARERFSQGQRMGDIASELRGQANDPAIGRMVGRTYVPASITQHGAKLMKQLESSLRERKQRKTRAGAVEEESGLIGDWLEELEFTAPPVPGAGQGNAS